MAEYVPRKVGTSFPLVHKLAPLSGVWPMASSASGLFFADAGRGNFADNLAIPLHEYVTVARCLPS
jgi:hypothetical protein